MYAEYPFYDLYNEAEKDEELYDLVVKVISFDSEDWGFIKEFPASFWLSYSWITIRKFMHLYPIYVLPTTELLDKLDELIGDFNTIEIGAGSGNIGRYLDIKMTDSYQQTLDSTTKVLYNIAKQPLVHYPSCVFKADARTAVRRFHPDCVLGCYVTHKYNGRDGNYKGVDFEYLLTCVKRLILVGNQNIHKSNPIMALPHQEIELQGIITRNEEHSLNRIYVWDKTT